jgi:hypothetical protein
MKSKTLSPFIASTLLLFTFCTPPALEKSEGNARIDSAYALIVGLTIEQLKITNKYFEDPKVTDAILEYSNAKTIYDQIEIVEALDPQQDITHPKAEKGIDFLTEFDQIDDASFDLAIQNNDVVAQQVKLMNSYFGGLGKETMDAITFYEAMSRDDKVKLFTNPNAFIPAPDYVQRYIGREFQRTYFLQRYLVLQRLNRYLLQRRYIKEFPQGFRQLQQIGYLEDEKQFDLKLARK